MKHTIKTVSYVDRLKQRSLSCEDSRRIHQGAFSISQHCEICQVEKLPDLHLIYEAQVDSADFFTFPVRILKSAEIYVKFCTYRFSVDLIKNN